jgi:dipeptidyl aminopeptidase/acylaminoacyl peptidase
VPPDSVPWIQQRISHEHLDPAARRETALTAHSLHRSDHSGFRLVVRRNPALSPDGTRVAIEALDLQSRTHDIWIIELAHGVASRFTFDPHNDIYPVWAPDGTRIAFGSDRQAGEFNLYTKLSNGTAGEELLLKSSVETLAAPYGWSPDGKFIVYRNYAPFANMGVLPLEGDRKPRPFQQVTFTQAQGQVSPNGRWLAYHATESGLYDVYVQSFPMPGAKNGRSRRTVGTTRDGVGTGKSSSTTPPMDNSWRCPSRAIRRSRSVRRCPSSGHDC